MDTLFPVDASRQPVVTVKNGEVFTNSRDVAAFFEKRHDHVLRDIDTLIAHAPDLGDRQFVRIETPHPTIPGRMDRSFDLTRDGFTLLAMVDTIHQRPDGTAKRTFSENRERFVESEDFIELTSDEIRTMSIFPARTARATLITRRGYLKLVKP
ncbi:Uncharacterised protein [Starkeya nomas]|uniref:Uncharacterized protein n=1 Tax=Starkeya nomas TaxID=2666134 RepID=A0A5S9NZL9_9HYPH|nr:Rha family transcriptional regulator [Starkeya nomas]CAA0096387.1 Uncharacterised protein [Starkeya nomas]